MIRAIMVVPVVVAGIGCGTPPCSSNKDCPIGTDCGLDGKCVTTSAATVEWLSPKDGSAVGDTYDAVVQVTFRGANAVLHVDRAARAGGDPCAPFVPQDIPLAGSAAGVLVQKVTIPKLPALGTDFKVFATLGAATDNAAVAELHGPATPYGGISFTAPTDHDADASSSLAVPVAATFDSPVDEAFLWTEPAIGPPTPKVLLGASLASIVTNAPLVRGDEIVWIETDSSTAAGGSTQHLCGYGLAGKGAATDAAAGLEVGLFYEGDAAGQLELRLRVDRANPLVCTHADPSASCEALFQTRGPSTFGQEALHVDTEDGDVVEILAVPGAAGPPITGTIRVSFDGEHVGYLGPMPIDPGTGEIWVAGTIAIRGALAEVSETDQIVTAAPF